MLIEAGATVDIADDSGLTPLLSACMLGGTQTSIHSPGSGAGIVVRLLQADADPLAQDKQGRNSIEIAKEYDRTSRTGWWKTAFRSVVEKMMREVPTRDYNPETGQREE